MDKVQINTLWLDTNIDIAYKSSLIYSISPNNDCSFCDKKSQEVRKIFKGKYATICDECVELCEEIIEEEVEERIKGGIDMRSASSDLMCSFCARAHLDPDLYILIAGPGKYICDKCALVFADELKFL